MNPGNIHLHLNKIALNLQPVLENIKRTILINQFMTRFAVRSWLATFVFFACFLIIHPLYPQDSAPEGKSDKRIRNVQINRLEVFPDTIGGPRFLYDLGNKLHIVTREQVIRRRLLFEAGDPYDPDLLKESERVLRRLPYIGEAEVSATPVNDQYVDVTVVTQDQWSTLASAIVDQGGGRTTVGISLEEFNLFGFGKNVLGEFIREPEGFKSRLRYSDPQVFGSRWTTHLAFESGPFLDLFSGQIVRPFYSLDTKWAGGVAASTQDAIDPPFEREGVSQIRIETDEFQLFGARDLGSRFNKARVQLTYRFARVNYSRLLNRTAPSDSVPEDERIHGLSLGLSLENVSFVEEKRIDNFVVTEDLTLGSLTSLTVGRTGLPFPTGVRRFELSLKRREAHQLFGNQYLIAILSVRSLFEEEKFKDILFSSRLQYYSKSLPHQTLAFNATFDVLQNRRNPFQLFFLGGNSGLRAYGAREFVGVKRLLFNLEDRIFTKVNVLTVALGGVLFLDAGNVWDEHEPLDLRELNYSLGFGIRLGYTKSPRSRVGRIDFGWALNDGGFGVTIGVDQIFSVN